jgi:ERCC4-type nuclease
MICQICQREFSNNHGLHRHIASHKIDIKDYYYKYFPRYDKGRPEELIIYKTYDQYFTSDFNSRESFVCWAAENDDKQEVANYCLATLKSRRDRKKEIYLPSQVELKSIMLPSFIGLAKTFGSIDYFMKEAENIGYKFRFNYSIKPVFKEGDIKIFVDTREQKPLKFNIPTVSMKLPTGDYSSSKNFFANVFIERKSIPDLFSTLVQGRDRFQNEIDKAREFGFYLVVVVDGGYTEATLYEPKTTFKSRVNGSHIFHEIREIMSKNDNIQFVFSGSRDKSAIIIEKILRLGEQARFLDLEYLKDIKEL